MPEWDGLLPPVSCGERPIIDGVRTPVAYSTNITACMIWVIHRSVHNCTLIAPTEGLYF